MKTTAKLLDFKASFWKADESLFFLLKTAQTVTSPGCRRILHRAGINYKTESSERPGMGSPRFDGIGENVQFESTLGERRFHAPWTRHSFSKRTLILFPGSMNGVNLMEPSHLPLPGFFLCGGATSGRQRSKLACFVDARLNKQREAVKVIDRGLLPVLFSSITPFYWGRKCPDMTPTRRWRRPFAQAASVSLVYGGSWENIFIVLKHMALIYSKEVFVRGT